LEDGQIEFLGRVDTQVKIRGLRIELGEIEASLAASALVRECIVIVREDVPGQKRIVAYVVLASQSSDGDDDSEANDKAQSVLRSLLKQSLPDYMVPTTWMFLSELPLTPNGKVDRRALPKPTADSESRLRDYVEPSTSSEIVVAQIMAEILGLKVVGVHDNFFDLGGHSLTATQLISRIHEHLSVYLTIHELFGAPTVAGIARAVTKKTDIIRKSSGRTDGAARDSSRGAAGYNDDRGEGMTNPIAPFDASEEILLPKEIRTGRSGHNEGDGYRGEVQAGDAGQRLLDAFARVRHARHIFLTGVTGFLGAYVLAELLRRCPSATVHCLIRVGSTEHKKSGLDDPAQYARSRLRQNLEKYGLFHECAQKSPMRVYPVVVGDLAKPRFGLVASRFQELGETIDAIFHCGAYVHSLYPYSRLRAANVGGTIEILRLATVRCREATRNTSSCRDGVSKGEAQDGAPSPVFYVSSLSVFPGGSTATVSDDQSTYELPLALLSQLGEGYAQTKLVAERLVVEAGRRGVPVKIFRPGRITGHSLTGATSIEDTFCRIIQGCLQLGASPDLDWPVDMNPVDFVAAAIVEASFVGFGRNGDATKSSEWHCYHMYNPNPWSLQRLFDWLVSDYGYRGQVEILGYEEWRVRLEEACSTSNKNALFPLLPIFPRDPSEVPTSADYPTFDCTQTFGLMGALVRKGSRERREADGVEGERVAVRSVGSALGGSSGKVPPEAWFRVDTAALSVMFDEYCRLGFPMPDLHNRDVFDMEGL
jgi:thioester reductase-like protein/acyl carrier protein